MNAKYMLDQLSIAISDKHYDLVTNSSFSAQKCIPTNDQSVPLLHACLSSIKLH